MYNLFHSKSKVAPINPPSSLTQRLRLHSSYEDTSTEELIKKLSETKKINHFFRRKNELVVCLTDSIQVYWKTMWDTKPAYKLIIQYESPGIVIADSDGDTLIYSCEDGTTKFIKINKLPYKPIKISVLPYENNDFLEKISRFTKTTPLFHSFDYSRITPRYSINELSSKKIYIKDDFWKWLAKEINFEQIKKINYWQEIILILIRVGLVDEQRIIQWSEFSRSILEIYESSINYKKLESTEEKKLNGNKIYWNSFFGFLGLANAKSYKSLLEKGDAPQPGQILFFVSYDEKNQSIFLEDYNYQKTDTHKMPFIEHICISLGNDLLYTRHLKLVSPTIDGVMLAINREKITSGFHEGLYGTPSGTHMNMKLACLVGTPTLS